MNSLRTLALIVSSLIFVACGTESTSEQNAINPNLLKSIKPMKDLHIAQLCAGPDAASSEMADAERRILDRTNAERQKNGLPALLLDYCASKIARQHSQNMANRNIMEHTIDGKGVVERLRDASFPFSIVHENIAYETKNYNGGPAWDFNSFVNTSMGFWTTSPTHRANVLRREVTHIGIGVAKSQHGANGYVTGTQVFFKP